MEPFKDFPDQPFPEPRRSGFAPLIFAAVAFTLVGILINSMNTKDPVFEKIDTLTIHYLSAKGLTEKPLSPPEQLDIIRCLFEDTSRIEKEALEIDLLPSTYLIELTNGDGRHSIELISRHNLADNRGYYNNTCIYSLIQ
jgi:hypothetical protein